MGILRILKEQFEMPWLCSGDFNEILFGFEKELGRTAEGGIKYA
jgi:hypothetical protein